METKQITAQGTSESYPNLTDNMILKRGIIQKYIMPFSVSDMSGVHWCALDTLKLVHIEQAMEAYANEKIKNIDAELPSEEEIMTEATNISNDVLIIKGPCLKMANYVISYIKSKGK